MANIPTEEEEQRRLNVLSANFALGSLNYFMKSIDKELEKEDLHYKVKQSLITRRGIFEDAVYALEQIKKENK